MISRIYIDTDRIIAGITMRDPQRPEENNMALHACADPECILQNRRNLASFTGCELEDFVSAYQTHSANFHKVIRADRRRGAAELDTAIPDTDALYTFEPGLLLCCFTADCVPVIFYDEESGLVGTIHSGWAGTAQEIAVKVLCQLFRVENCRPENLHIYIGPAISRDRFEVGQDVYDRFKALGYGDEFLSFNEKTGKYHIDNQLTVKRQCELSGVPTAHIFVDRTCTYDGSDCFSYRRDKGGGRHLSFIMRRR